MPSTVTDFSVKILNSIERLFSGYGIKDYFLAMCPAPFCSLFFPPVPWVLLSECSASSALT